MGMAQIGGQDRQTPLRIVTTAIPAQQRLNCKTVTKVMQAGPPARIRTAQSNLPGEDVERAVNLALVQTVAVLVYEERPVSSGAKAVVPTLRRNRPGPYRLRDAAVPIGTFQTSPL